MNRRGFIASISFLPAVIKAVMAAPAKAWQGAILLTPWLQTKRMTYCTSLGYEDALDQIFEKDPVVLRKNYSARRWPRFKTKLARQLAMPAPNLP